MRFDADNLVLTKAVTCCRSVSRLVADSLVLTQTVTCCRSASRLVADSLVLVQTVRYINPLSHILAVILISTVKKMEQELLDVVNILLEEMRKEDAAKS